MRNVGRYARIVSTEAPDTDGWVRVSMLFEEEHSACEYILSFGAQMEIVEPEALREKVIEAAESIVALYESSKIVP